MAYKNAIANRSYHLKVKKKRCNGGMEKKKHRMHADIKKTEN